MVLCVVVDMDSLSMIVVAMIEFDIGVIEVALLACVKVVGAASVAKIM